MRYRFFFGYTEMYTTKKTPHWYVRRSFDFKNNKIYLFTNDKVLKT
jgi:hypothetical protein